MPEQLALPFIADLDKQAEKERVAAKRSYPITAEEGAALPLGVRLCRFVPPWECERCPYDTQDHTIGWKFQMKICLKDYYKQGKSRYRIMNRATKEWWNGHADSAHEACEKAGWMIGDCWVRQYSPKGSGGWKNPDDAPELGRRRQ